MHKYEHMLFHTELQHCWLIHTYTYIHTNEHQRHAARTALHEYSYVLLEHGKPRDMYSECQVGCEKVPEHTA